MFEEGFCIFVTKYKKSTVIVFPRFLLPYLFLLTVITAACHRNASAPETIEAYYLQYDIKYLEDMAGDIPTRILPRTMDAFYSKPYVYTRIEGFFNQFTLVQIADLKENKVTTLLDFFGNTGDLYR